MIECGDASCDRTFDTQRGASLHFSRTHDENGGKVEKTCPVCDEVFYTTRSMADEVYRCSLECRNEGGNREYSSVVRECASCGNDVRVPTNRAERTDNSFCDRECFGEWKSRSMMGTSHRAYDGGQGLSYALRVFYGDEPWMETSRRVRDESGDCELCGDDDMLHVHHLLPIKCGGTNADWNLVSVCPTCHKKAELFIREFVDATLFPI